ncbi:hypothetical protein [Novosphingobium sp. CF614]|uniref:hypothetical protein n=1 Tax=Novosphingobium sp. CF614 TaxID=1884364 RepID=UPI00116021FB|nr:hypothetical protein [Novosphingobium sp. CF614]
MENQQQPQQFVVTHTQAPSNGLGTSAMVLGIVSIVLAFIPVLGLIAWITSPLALILGLIGVTKNPKGGAITGIVLGAIGIAVCLLWASMFGAIIAAGSAGTTPTEAATQ